MRLAHSCGEAITAELMAGHKAAGIDTIEVSVGNMELAAALDFAKTRELADEYGIELWSLHLPFLPFHVIDPSNPAIADYTVEYFCSLIDKAVEIGIKAFVVHPSGEPIAESDRPMRMECAKKSLAALAEYRTANEVRFRDYFSTVNDSIELALRRAHKSGKMAQEALERVGLGERGRHKPAELSGGQQ